jgi:hypothetical protein
MQVSKEELIAVLAQRVQCGDYSNDINRERYGSFVTASYGFK